MDLPGQTYRGAALDDVEILERLPRDYLQLLASQNGFVAFRGGLHVRGACREPDWHSIRAALEGPRALHRLFPGLRADDVPFGQDALGSQFVLRAGTVYRLDPVGDGLQSLGADLAGFFAAALENPVEYLRLDPLLRFEREGGRLRPGQLLAAARSLRSGDAAGVSFRALPVGERLDALAELARRSGRV